MYVQIYARGFAHKVCTEIYVDTYPIIHECFWSELAF